MTIEEMIKKYDLRLAKEGMIGIYNTDAVKRDGTLDLIKEKKPEIIAYIKAKEEAEKKAHEEREAKIEAIEGLAEIKNAIYERNNYRIAFEKMMDDEYNDGVFPPKAPKSNPDELMKKYPRAAAYITAEGWTYSTHFVKSSAGRKALERIINGEDYEAALRDMDKEFSDYCDEHMWD